MPGTIMIDAGETFAAMLVLGITPKFRFGTQEQDISQTGERKWTCETAVTYKPDPGMRATSEVIAVTVTGGTDPSVSIAPGTPVTFDRLRCGFSAPERGNNDRIRGGKPYFMASAIRAASGAQNGARPLASAGAKSE
jgi:hypothetical protein